MKKYCFLILLISTVVLLNFTGCTNNNTAEKKNIYVSLRNSTPDNVQNLKWVVENRSKNDSVTFNNGDILNYEIRHSTSGKIYTSSNKDYTDITLKPGETYETTVNVKDMLIGHYEAKFWAKSGETRKSTMIIYFDIEAEDKN